MTRWLGVDVGGANLKVADGEGFANSVPFELWRQPDGLAEALRELLAQAPPFDALAATMTGELADCYQTKRDGVIHIAEALSSACTVQPLWFYGVDGKFRDPDSLRIDPLVSAASNWHALARYASRDLPLNTGLVIDIGSTTTDIIPVVNGQVATHSRTDTERLLTGELVYMGVGRTPICAAVTHVPYRGKMCPIAAELFATTADVYRLLEGTEADAGTADGRSMSEQDCVDRLARQICADREEFSMADALAAGEHVRREQLRIIREAIGRVALRFSGRPVTVMVSGSGERLALAAAESLPSVGGVRLLSSRIGSAHSSAAAAAAVAALASTEQLT